MQRLRLGVLGEFGMGNLGREAALVAFVQWVRRHAAHVEPVALFARHGYIGPEPGITIDPGATALNDQLARPGSARTARANATLAGDRRASGERAPRDASSGAGSARFAVALARVWPRQLRCARQLAGIVALGSGPAEQAIDFAHALRLWSWAQACRFAAKPFVMLSFSAPRAVGWFARLLLRSTLRRAAYVSVADTASERWISATRRGRPTGHAPNPLFDLTFDPRWESKVDPWQGRTQPMKAGAVVLTYGVSPSRAGSQDKAGYERYIGALARLCATTVRAGHRIVMFATDPVSDRRAVLDLLARVPADVLYGVHVEEGTSVGDIARAARGVRAVIATRAHGALWGLWAGRPVVLGREPSDGAPSFEPLDSAHDGPAAVSLHADTYDAEAMVNALAAVTANYDERCARLAASLTRARAEIDASYHAAFACGGWEGTVSAPVRRDGVSAEDPVAAPGRV